jgi:hypothetical protein
MNYFISLQNKHYRPLKISSIDLVSQNVLSSQCENKLHCSAAIHEHYFENIFLFSVSSAFYLKPCLCLPKVLFREEDVGTLYPDALFRQGNYRNKDHNV